MHRFTLKLLHIYLHTYYYLTTKDNAHQQRKVQALILSQKQ